MLFFWRVCQGIPLNKAGLPTFMQGSGRIDAKTAAFRPPFSFRQAGQDHCGFIIGFTRSMYACAFPAWTVVGAISMTRFQVSMALS